MGMLPAGSSAPGPRYPPVLHGGIPLASSGRYGLASGAAGPAVPRGLSGALTAAHSQDCDGPARIRHAP